jgi:hypothetical protein
MTTALKIIAQEYAAWTPAILVALAFVVWSVS